MLYSKTGCQTCKSRRIKCDEAKPVCRRCAKSQRECLRVRLVKPACLRIQVENSYASGQNKRPRGPRPHSSLTLFSPSFDVPTRAVAYYLNYYLYELADLPTVSACMSECLTAWKASSRKSSMVDLAISALALGIFSRTQKHSLAAREAFRMYGCLLRVVHEQITPLEIIGCNEEGLDESLLVIVLMAWYETTMHQPADLNLDNTLSSLHSWSHHDGAMAILRVWINKFGDNAPSGIIKHSRRGLLRSALLRNLPLPCWIQDGSRFGEHGLDLGFDVLLVRVVNLCHKFKYLEKKPNLKLVEIEDLISEAQDLDEGCREWEMLIPSEWSHQQYSTPGPWSRTDFYSAKVYVYARHGYAAVWIQYFALRMLITGTLLSLFQLYSLPEFEAYKQLCLRYKIELNTMADSIASTIPFSLGRFIAHKTSHADSRPALVLNVTEEITPALGLPTVWPLSVASSFDCGQPHRQLWFLDRLACLGHVLGDGALMCAGTDSWTHG